MKIELEIKSEVIANLFCSAIEGGDPVTSAAKGGWCDGIFLGGLSKGQEDKWETKDGYPWYANPKLYSRATLCLEIIEIDNEQTQHRKFHKSIGQGKIVKGLKIMAEKFPNIFSQILEDNVDAPCADIFLQCILFGEEKYA